MVGIMETAFDRRFGEAWNGAQLVAALEAPESFGEIALADENVLAFSLARLVVDEGELLLVAVRPEWRRTGIAARLVSNVLAQARARGGRAVYLEVRDGNIPAVELYRRSGFAQVGRRRAYYAGDNQARFDAMTMRLEL